MGSWISPKKSVYGGLSYVSPPLSAFPPYGSGGREGKKKRKCREEEGGGRRRPSSLLSRSYHHPRLCSCREGRERAYSLHTEHPELERVQAREERKQGRRKCRREVDERPFSPVGSGSGRGGTVGAENARWGSPPPPSEDQETTSLGLLVRSFDVCSSVRGGGGR